MRTALLDELVDRLRRQVLVVALVDLHHRRGAAGGQALGGAQSDAPVFGGLAYVNTEAFLAVLDQVFGAAESARQCATHPHLVLPRLLLIEQRVKSDDPFDVRAAEIELFGDELDSLRSFDPITQISREAIGEAVIPPAGELGLLKRAPAESLGTIFDYLGRDAIFVLSNGAILERLNFAVALSANKIPGTMVQFDEPIKSVVTRLGSPEFQKR